MRTNLAFLALGFLAAFFMYHQDKIVADVINGQSVCFQNEDSSLMLWSPAHEVERQVMDASTVWREEPTLLCRLYEKDGMVREYTASQIWIKRRLEKPADKVHQ